MEQPGNVKKLAAKGNQGSTHLLPLALLLRRENTGILYCECSTGNVQSCVSEYFVLVRNVYTACAIIS